MSRVNSTNTPKSPNSPNITPVAFENRISKEVEEKDKNYKAETYTPFIKSQQTKKEEQLKYENQMQDRHQSTNEGSPEALETHNLNQIQTPPSPQSDTNTPNGLIENEDKNNLSKHAQPELSAPRYNNPHGQLLLGKRPSSGSLKSRSPSQTDLTSKYRTQLKDIKQHQQSKNGSGAPLIKHNNSTNNHSQVLTDSHENSTSTTGPGLARSTRTLIDLIQDKANYRMKQNEVNSSSLQKTHNTQSTNENDQNIHVDTNQTRTEIPQEVVTTQAKTMRERIKEYNKLHHNFYNKKKKPAKIKKIKTDGASKVESLAPFTVDETLNKHSHEDMKDTYESIRDKAAYKIQSAFRRYMERRIKPNTVYKNCTELVSFRKRKDIPEHYDFRCIDGNKIYKVVTQVKVAQVFNSKTRHKL
ncbi:hypothetical protein AKO1_011594 [Acrasis kona]|uniref:Uncharacterized protein n=1 Tax=Acrasis kona TaxID=1008807 RepID=A0AAW2Z5D2_9EUKA